MKAKSLIEYEDASPEDWGTAPVKAPKQAVSQPRVKGHAQNMKDMGDEATARFKDLVNEFNQTNKTRFVFKETTSELGGSGERWWVIRLRGEDERYIGIHLDFQRTRHHRLGRFRFSVYDDDVMKIRELINKNPGLVLVSVLAEVETTLCRILTDES